MSPHVFSQICDFLLGADRNELPNDTSSNKKHFSNPEVKFCPHDLFPNTRSNLGSCPRVHDEVMKTMYENSPLHDYYAAIYEEELKNFLIKIVRSVEYKIEKAYERIETDLPKINLSPSQKGKIESYLNEIDVCLRDAERAGEDGNVELASKLNNKAASLQKEVDKINSQSHGPYVQREKSLRVCSICGAMQSVGDTMTRFESHVSGKQHIGHEKIRSLLSVLQRRHTERKQKQNQHNSEKKISDFSSGGYYESENKFNSNQNYHKKYDKQINSYKKDVPKKKFANLYYNRSSKSHTYKNGGGKTDEEQEEGQC